MWEISNWGQGGTLLYALSLGALLCGFYDVFRLDRIIFKRGTVAVFLQDLLFWLISAFATVCLFILKTNGQTRIFVLLAMLIGFFIYRLTISRLIDKIAPFIKIWVKKTRRFYIKGVMYLGKIDKLLKKTIKLVFIRTFLDKKEAKKAKNNAKSS